jgi:DNA-binding transcriptional MerR regulator
VLRMTKRERAAAAGGTYSKRNIAEFLKLPVRTVTFWTDFGLIVPAVRPSQGRGIARLFDYTNLLQFAMIDALSRKLGINLDDVQKIMLALNAGHYKQTEFGDFFTHSDWGLKRELLYFEKTPDREGPARSRMESEYQFMVVPLAERGGDPKIDLPLDGLFSRILRLGKVRNMVIVDQDFFAEDLFGDLVHDHYD